MSESTRALDRIALPVEEQYLHAYGRALEAARNGDRTFVVDTEITKTVRSAGVHAYIEAGADNPGMPIQEERTSGDELYLAMYRRAYHAVISGGSEITLPVRTPYENPLLRRAVTDACREAGKECALKMQAVPEPPRYLGRLVGSYLTKRAVRINSPYNW